jgi:hypothetical protein
MSTRISVVHRPLAGILHAKGTGPSRGPVHPVCFASVGKSGKLQSKFGRGGLSSYEFSGYGNRTNGSEDKGGSDRVGVKCDLGNNRFASDTRIPVKTY